MGKWLEILGLKELREKAKEEIFFGVGVGGSEEASVSMEWERKSNPCQPTAG